MAVFLIFSMLAIQAYWPRWPVYEPSAHPTPTVTYRPDAAPAKSAGPGIGEEESDDD